MPTRSFPIKKSMADLRERGANQIHGGDSSGGLDVENEVVLDLLQGHAVLQVLVAVHVAVARVVPSHRRNYYGSAGSSFSSRKPDIRHAYRI